MQDESKWPTVHEYMHRTRTGEVPVIRCPDCDYPVTVGTDKNADPILVCYGCRTRFSIALFAYDAMVKNLKELND